MCDPKHWLFIFNHNHIQTKNVLYLYATSKAISGSCFDYSLWCSYTYINSIYQLIMSILKTRFDFKFVLQYSPTHGSREGLEFLRLGLVPPPNLPKGTNFYNFIQFWRPPRWWRGLNLEFCFSFTQFSSLQFQPRISILRNNKPQNDTLQRSIETREIEEEEVGKKKPVRAWIWRGERI